MPFISPLMPCTVMSMLVRYSLRNVFQYVSEKIGGAKGTELEDDIVEMEKVT